jgi:hypothetical protein
LNEFVPIFISFLLRDFDSQDLSITNALRNILKSVEKRSKAEQCQAQLASLFLRAIASLWSHSKLTSWLLPKVIQYNKSMKIVVFSQFIELAQDPSHAALAEKCSRLLLGNWQDFLLAIIKKANHLVDLCDQDSVFVVAAPSLASSSSGLGTLASDRRNNGVLDIILAAPIEEMPDVGPCWPRSDTSR